MYVTLIYLAVLLELGLFYQGMESSSLSVDDYFYMYLSSVGDVLLTKATQKQYICDTQYIYSQPTNISYSIGNREYSHTFDNSYSCPLLDGDVIGQHLDEQILFHYNGICKKKTEFQCLGRDIVRELLFCGNLEFINFTDAGKKRVRVTWTCFAYDGYEINCRIGWSRRNSLFFRTVASVWSYFTKQINLDPPIYQYTCELETDFSEINRSPFGPTYELATRAYIPYLFPLCSRYSDSLSNYPVDFAPTVTLEIDPSLSITQCGVLVEPGNKLVFKAILDGSNVTSTDWPLDKIIMLFFFNLYAGFQDLCEINIEQDGCKGFQPSLCGYCNTTAYGVYHIVFNVTVPYVDKNRYNYGLLDGTFQCLWIGKKATISDTSSVIIANTGNFIWEADITETQIMNLSSNGDVVWPTPIYEVRMCNIYKGKVSDYFNYSIGGQFNSSVSFGLDSGDCRDLDENMISLLQRPDEKILFHQHDNCSGTIEYECLSQDFLKQRLFCNDFIFTNFTDGGISRVRVTWTCLKNDPVPLDCWIGWLERNTTKLKEKIASSYEHYRKRIYQDPPVYYFTCELEMDSSEIYNKTYERLYQLATRTTNFYVSHHCTGFSDSLSNYTESESSLPWLEIGIGIGGLILVIVIVIIIICLVRRKRARNRQAMRDNHNNLDFKLSNLDNSTQQPKPADQYTRDERQKNQTSGGLKSRGRLPDIPDNDSHVDSTDCLGPEEAPYYVNHCVEPQDSPDYVYPEDSTQYVNM